MLRALQRTGKVLPVDYQAERRQLAQARRAAFAVPPAGPNQVWQLGGIADYWSKLELGWQVSSTQNQRDAIETVEQALAETERLLGRPLTELLTDPLTGEVRPLALVTDNGPCFKAARFAAFVKRRPERTHIRTRRKSPQQNGVLERASKSMKYEHLYRHEIDDGHQLGLQVEHYRTVCNTIRPHEAIGMRRPLDVHLENCNDHQTPKSNKPETLPPSSNGTHLRNLSTERPSPARALSDRPALLAV